jgi:hypothetical protein
MNSNDLIQADTQKNEEIHNLLLNAKRVCCDFFYDKYDYCDKEAVEELGLESELIEQLVEDYVIQVIKSLELFREYIQTLQLQQKNNQTPDFTPLRELAHKNLGVARNLRIKDSEEILLQLMRQENIEDFPHYIDVLEACVIRLKPSVAYSTLKLIKIKKNL